MVVLQTAEESGSKAPSCTTPWKTCTPPCRCGWSRPCMLVDIIEFQNRYKTDNDKINYKDKLQSTIILTKSYYTKNPLF